MAIPLKTPVSVNATYDEVWLSELRVIATNPNGKVIIQATIDECRTDENGKKELRGPSGKHTVVIPDFFKVATPEEIQIMGGLIMAIKARGNL